MNHQLPESQSWTCIRLARRLGPQRAARRLGISVDDLARICAGFLVSPRVVRSVVGALAVSRLPKAA